jgi:hypothetical protein
MRSRRGRAREDGATRSARMRVERSQIARLGVAAVVGTVARRGRTGVFLRR